MRFFHLDDNPTPQDVLDHLREHLIYYKMTVYECHYDSYTVHRIKLYIFNAAKPIYDITYTPKHAIIKTYKLKEFHIDGLVENRIVVSTKEKMHYLNTLLEDHFGQPLPELWDIHHKAMDMNLPNNLQTGSNPFI